MHIALRKQKQNVAIHLPASKDIFPDYSTTVIGNLNVL
jgi:hypothetical protein